MPAATAGGGTTDERFKGIGAALGDHPLIVPEGAGQVLGPPELVGHRRQLGGDTGAGDRVELGEQVVHARVVVDPHRRFAALALALLVGLAAVG